MKKYFKAVVACALALTIGIGGVDAATDTKKINSNSCETIYTNYYFFLDANTTEFFNQTKLSNISNEHVAEYHNNSYLTKDFNKLNVGYGQVKLDKNTKTSSDGITSMSLSEYYTHYLKAMGLNGAYTSGTKNYIVSHDWYRVHDNGALENIKAGLDLADYSKNTLIGATLDAYSTITRQTAISYRDANPFQLTIERDYTGYLTGSPLTFGGYEWYIHPAVYYVQYCSTDTADEEYYDEYDVYRIFYEGNGSNVSNVPSTDITYEDECTSISTKTPIRDNYKFLGWSTYSDASTPNSTYAPGKTYCGNRGNLTLYAVWEKISSTTSDVYSYGIYYRSNTSDYVANMPAEGRYNSNNDAYISSQVPVRNGYTFLGWSTDSTSPVANSNYRSGSLYTDRKDIVLYAIWQKDAVVTPDDTGKPGDPNLPENPQTAVTDYLLPFGSAIGASGAGLGLLKRKKSFKQF